MVRLVTTCGGILMLTAALLPPASGLAEESGQAATAAEPAARAVIVGEEIERKGKVLSIDRDTRTVVLEGEQGRQISIRVPEEAANFDKVSVGDPVVARYYESLALAIAPVVDAEPGASALAAVSLAAPGATPGGVIADQVQLRAVVRAVDPEARTVTLEVPAGGERTLKAREGVDLSNVKVGEQVSVTHTRALAISLTPQ